MFDFIVQFIGFLGIALNLIAVQFNTHCKIVFLKTLGSLMFGIQYAFLGFYTNVVMEAVGWVRNLVFIYTVKKNRSTKFFIWLFSFITVITGLISIYLSWDKTIQSVGTWTSDHDFAVILALIISAMSIIAKILSTVAYGIKNAHSIRMLNIPTSSLWFFNNLLVGSLAGMVNEVMVLSSIWIAERRYKKILNRAKTNMQPDQPLDPSPTITNDNASNK